MNDWWDIILVGYFFGGILSIFYVVVFFECVVKVVFIDVCGLLMFEVDMSVN